MDHYTNIATFTRGTWHLVGHLFLCSVLESSVHPLGILLIRLEVQHYLTLLCVSENYLETVPPVDDY